MWHNERTVIYEQGSGPLPDKSASTLTVDFPAFRTARNTFLLFISHSLSLRYSGVAAQMDEAEY